MRTNVSRSQCFTFMNLCNVDIKIVFWRQFCFTDFTFKWLQSFMKCSGVICQIELLRKNITTHFNVLFPSCKVCICFFNFPLSENLYSQCSHPYGFYTSYEHRKYVFSDFVCMQKHNCKLIMDMVNFSHVQLDRCFCAESKVQET